MPAPDPGACCWTCCGLLGVRALSGPAVHCLCCLRAAYRSGTAHSDEVPACLCAAASRAIAVAASALLAPLPLPLHLPVQLFSLAMVRGGGGVCRTRLLTHPLTRRRAEGFHFFSSSLAQLGVCSLDPLLHEPFAVLLPGSSSSLPANALLALLTPAAHRPCPLLAASSGPQMLLRRLQEDASGERSCEALLSCVHIFVGLVAGTAILVKTRAEVAVGSWQAGDGQPSSSSGGRVGRWAADAHRKVREALEAATCLLFGHSWVPVPARQQQPGSGTSTWTIGSELDMSLRLMAWWALICVVWTLSALLS